MIKVLESLVLDSINNDLEIRSITLAPSSYELLADELDYENPDHILGNCPELVFGSIRIVKGEK